MTENFTSLTAAIVTAYAGTHQLKAEDLPTLIRSVHDTLKGLGNGAAPAPEETRLAPAVPIKRSVTPDYIICLEDGRKLKMMKRYLRTTYNMTPEDYRAKWGLPADYPMVAPNYAAKRSEFARTIGLGTKGRGAGKKK